MYKSQRHKRRDQWSRARMAEQYLRATRAADPKNESGCDSMTNTNQRSDYNDRYKNKRNLLSR